jgi:arylsulfatase A-like enzyme
VIRRWLGILSGLLPALLVLAAADVASTYGIRLGSTRPAGELALRGLSDWLWSVGVLGVAGLVATLPLAALRLQRVSPPGLGALLGCAFALVYAVVATNRFSSTATSPLAAQAGWALPIVCWLGASGLAIWRIRTGEALRFFAWIAPPLIAVAPLTMGSAAYHRTAPDESGGPATPQPRRQVGAEPPSAMVLITLDTTRFDALAFSGLGGVLVPTLEQIAREGTSFEQATTYLPITLPSHASMLSGRLPPEAAVMDNGVTVPGSIPLIPELLAEAGWRTGAVVSARVLASSYGLSRGFEHYHEEMDEGFRPSRVLVLAAIVKKLRLMDYRYQRGGAEVTRLALEWLEGDDPRPPFLWAHYFDPHTPYEPAAAPENCTHGDALAQTDPETLRRYLRGQSPPQWYVDHARALYLAEVKELEAPLAELVAGLKRLGLWDRALVVVAGDHGESFEHDLFFEHGNRIHEGTLRVPLLLRWPGVVSAGERRSEPAGFQDLLPTFLEAAGVPPPAGVSGRSLLDAPPPADRPMLSFHTSRAHGDHRYSAARTPDHKLVLDRDTGEIRLYDLRRDPGELTDRSQDPAYSEIRETLSAALAAHLAGEGHVEKSADQITDPQTLEMLKQLGYVEE